MLAYLYKVTMGNPVNFGDTELQLTPLNLNRSDSNVANEAKMLAKALCLC